MQFNARLLLTGHSLHFLECLVLAILGSISWVTGTASYAASETFPVTMGMSHSGRSSPFPTTQSCSFVLAVNGRLLVGTGRS